jgi:hypothetical protein
MDKDTIVITKYMNEKIITFCDERLTVYLPGNGGLLSAVAMMCVADDGSLSIIRGFQKMETGK